MNRWPRRWRVVLGLAALAASALALLAAHAALRVLETEIATALGPGAEIGAIRIGVTALEIVGLRIPGGAQWPGADALRAARMRIAPSWRSLLSSRAQIARIEIDEPYLSILRTRDGRLRVLPSLLEAEEESAPAQADATMANVAAHPTVAIGEVAIRAGTVEIFDAAVAREPWRLRLVDLNVRAGDVVAPALDARMPIEARAALEGPQHDGRVALRGWLVPATRDLELRLDLSGIDLLALEPYLVEATKARLSRGTLDLGVTAKVARKHLRAPGRLALSNLAFARGGRASARLLGVPRNLLLAALQAKGGRIELDFSLDGRLDDPKFSLQETVSTRLAVALAKEAGVSVSGLVEGTVGLGLEGLEGAGRAAGAIGSMLDRFLPR